MKLKIKLSAIASAIPFLLLGCGGGGSSNTTAVTPSPTSINGTITPPPAPTPVTTLAYPAYAGATAATNMLLPSNSPYASFASIVQTTVYALDSSVAPALKAAAVTISPVDPYAPLAMSTGLAYAGDLGLGMINQFTTTSPTTGAAISAALNYSYASTLGGLPAAVYAWYGTPTASLLLPHSLALNPAGYTYQTFGNWAGTRPFGNSNESWFSVGIPTLPASLPTTGTASYSGHSESTHVIPSTRDLANAVSTITATVDFTNKTVALAATATTTLSLNAAAGTAPSALPVLNFTGTLAYANGSNGFTGPITTTNGMTGNATCRFYGPALAVATVTKAVGSPPEIGCTFAVSKAGVGAMSGALGAN